MTKKQHQLVRLFENVWENYQPTSLLEVPTLAEALGLARVFVKLENERPLGNFKSLGGLWAAFRALARHTGQSVENLIGEADEAEDLPVLTCASDGNHGLAVSAAANRAGSHAIIFLPDHVSKDRAARIEALGGRIAWVHGTYDEAVSQAEAFAAEGCGLLVPDTTRDKDSEVVKDIMVGYSLIADELKEQFGKLGLAPTHFFVPAGVGGLVAAMADTFSDAMADPRMLIAVEPENAACVGAALQAREPILIDGDLATDADMLSCGLVSAPALEILLRQNVCAVSVSEKRLHIAKNMLLELVSVETTPSGAAGLAGLMAVAERPDSRASCSLNEESTVLIPVTESSVPTLR